MLQQIWLSKTSWDYEILDFEVKSYPNKLIKQEMEKVNFDNVVRQRHPKKGIPFLLTYHPLLKYLNE